MGAEGHAVNGDAGGNAQTKVLWWILGSLAAPVLLALTGTMLNLGISSAQRVSSLEAKWEEIHRQNEQIILKIDRLLEKR